MKKRLFLYIVHAPRNPSHHSYIDQFNLMFIVASAYLWWPIETKVYENGVQLINTRQWFFFNTFYW